MARVLLDVAALTRPFDYAVPDHLRAAVAVGTIVRVPLHGRRVRGWVVELSDKAQTERPLLPIARVTGTGPSPELVDLAEWAGWRWAGAPSRLLGTASPPHAVRSVERRSVPSRCAPGDAAVRLFRVPPAGDTMPHILEAAGRGDALILVPSHVEASIVAASLRQAGHRVAVAPRDWEQAAAGGCVVVGTRAAAWAPVSDLAAVVVVDEHDEVYQEERTPTWNARDVAVERARRAGVPCVLTSPCPSLETLAWAGVVAPSRDEERAGWPVVHVIDRREEAPGRGLYSDRLVDAVRQAGPGRRVVCVLNRKGRVRLLACVACGELARCLQCQGALEQTDEGLSCRRCGAVQPGVCPMCGSARLKALRVGVTRVRDELELLAGQDVGEVTAEAKPGPLAPASVLVGTEAVLHRVAGAATVAFLDFDQELLAPRYRAAERALGLLARAARLVGSRSGGGSVYVQTRMADHEVLDAARHADPSRLAVVESARRAALRLPPETALARVSGPAADEVVDALRGVLGLELLGPGPGGWLVRAPDHPSLADALAAVPRPSGRVRIEVDPLRA